MNDKSRVLASVLIAHHRFDTRPAETSTSELFDVTSAAYKHPDDSNIIADKVYLFYFIDLGNNMEPAARRAVSKGKYQ